MLERGPGREHITIQSYMLAMVAGLGALYALILAWDPVRDFFELEVMSAGQWFLAMVCVALGLLVAAAAWRLPQIQRLEEAAPEGQYAPASSARQPTPIALSAL